MTEIRCDKCNRKLGQIKLNSDHAAFDIDIKCPKCKFLKKYKVNLIKLEDQESRE